MLAADRFKWAIAHVFHMLIPSRKEARRDKQSSTEQFRTYNNIAALRRMIRAVQALLLKPKT